MPDLSPQASLPALRALADASPEPCGIARGAVIAHVNAALARLLGYASGAQLRDRPLVEVVAPGSREMFAEFSRRRAAGEDVPAVYNARLLRADGEPVAVEIRNVTVVLPDGMCTLSAFRPVAERELVTRDGDDFYRAMFEVNTAVKLLIDPASGRIVDANHAAADFYGWPLDELRAMRITDINTLTADEVAAEMEEARVGRRKYFRFRHRTASGAIRHVEVYSGPVRVGGDRLLLSIVHDVTERDHLEAQLRDAQRLDAIGRLAGGVAHDFNNLLTIMMSAAVLLRRLLTDRDALSLLDDLDYAAGRAGELTRALLAFGRRQMLAPAVVDLNELVAGVARLLDRATGPDIVVEVSLADDCPQIFADPSQIEQVIMNLGLNGRDAMRGGGTLRLSTERIEQHGPGGAVPAGVWAALRVSDTGAGMDEETQRRAFEPFFTTKDVGEGTGLGLATVYGIVAQSGGHVVLRSEPGAGTEFVVYLPRAEVPARVSNVPEAAHPIAGRARTLLLVDDVAGVRAVLAGALRSAGFQVIEAGSAEEALALPGKTLAGIEALVTDVVMPGRSGIDLAVTLRQDRPTLPVLLISGDVRGHDQTRLVGAVASLQKPFVPEQLLARLGQLLPD